MGIGVFSGRKIVLFFDDGNGVSRKNGILISVSRGLVIFSEKGKDTAIPVCRIVRIEFDEQ